VQNVKDVLKEMNLPPEYQVIFTGRAKQLVETFQNFLIAFGLAMIFMYMILAAAVRAFRSPGLHSAGGAAFVAVRADHDDCVREPLNIYAIFGLFMLFGIVKKNGILQIDYTNTLRARAWNVRRRFCRPIARGCARF